MSRILQPLAQLIGANMNVTSDQLLNITLASKYIARRIVVCNPSLNLTLAVGGIYTAASKGGTAIVANTQVYTALTGSTKFLDLTLATILGTDILTAQTLFFSLTTGQGAAATADIFVFGEVLAP